MGREYPNPKKALHRAALAPLLTISLTTDFIPPLSQRIYARSRRLNRPEFTGG